MQYLASSITLFSDFEDKDHKYYIPTDIMTQDYHHRPLGFIKISNVKSSYTG